MKFKLFGPVLLVLLLAACGGSLTPAADSEIQVSLDATGVADSWDWADIPATPYDNSSPPGPTGLPNHVQITFNGTDPATRQPGDPVIYIIPVEAYLALWDEAGDDAVAVRMDQLREIIASGDVPSTGIGALPIEAASGYNDLSVQSLVTTLGEWQGFRFIGRYEQSANPVTNEGLRYIFQGFSADGEYLVAAFWPEMTTGDVLPATAADVSAEDMESVVTDNQAYMQAQMNMLNALEPSQWNPDPTALDAMIATLTYQND